MARDDEGNPLLREAQVLAAQRAVAEVDLLRRLPALVQQLSPAQLAHRIGLTQAAVEALLERAKTFPPSAPRFSGADPYEIARWPYPPSRPLGEPIDTEYELGDWDTGVLPAVPHGLLSDADYEELFRRTEAATE